MAAPVAVARQDPAGIKLRDGYRALYTFTADPDVSFWEKQVQPPGVEGGDPIDQTTMHNNDWRTQAPRSLKSLTPVTGTVAYDPNVYNQIVALVNVATTITVVWHDGSTIAYFGYLRSFIPAALVEGTQPEASITIEPTNEDQSLAGAYEEQAPVLTSVAGT